MDQKKPESQPAEPQIRKDLDEQSAGENQVLDTSNAEGNETSPILSESEPEKLSDSGTNVPPDVEETLADQAEPDRVDAESGHGMEPTAESQAEQPSAEPDIPWDDLPTQPMNTTVLMRHPTGTPEEIGGWYGEGLESPEVTSPTGTDADQTIPSQAWCRIQPI